MNVPRFKGTKRGMCKTCIAFSNTRTTNPYQMTIPQLPSFWACLRPITVKNSRIRLKKASRIPILAAKLSIPMNSSSQVKRKKSISRSARPRVPSRTIVIDSKNPFIFDQSLFPPVFIILQKIHSFMLVGESNPPYFYHL